MRNAYSENELQDFVLREFSLRSVNGTLCVHELQDYVLRCGYIKYYNNDSVAINSRFRRKQFTKTKFSIHDEVNSFLKDRKDKVQRFAGYFLGKTGILYIES